MPEILSVIGARPQFIKAAAVSRALAEAGLAEQIIHTGQHYDEAMSDRLLTDLGIDNIAVNLGAGSGSHAEQTARMMVGIADHLAAQPRQPDWVLVYGDTNSTVAASLVAAKIGIPIAHIEAGLRSFNRAMPEEINRVVTDHLSEVLFCPSPVAVNNLAAEGISAGVQDVGDVMLDAFHLFSPEARQKTTLDALAPGLEPGFVLATLHRPGNTDDPARFQAILDMLGTVASPVLWPVHPRNTNRLAHARLPSNVRCCRPASYFEMLLLLAQCRAVITDSGGLQKEAYWAKRRCLTVRPETEWVETLEGGWNTLVEPGIASLETLIEAQSDRAWTPLYGDGQAGRAIAQTLAARA